MYRHRTPPKHYLGSTLPDKTAVIILPGFLEKWGFMKPLADRISRHGHPTYIVPGLGHNVTDIPSAAKTVRILILQAVPQLGQYVSDDRAGAHAIRSLLEKFDIKQAVFVAHSKGGLIGKYYLAHLNSDKRISGMVAVATPFSGSALARLVPHASFRELAAGHDIISDLQAHRDVNRQIVSIFPKFDNHILTKDASWLEGANNIQVDVSGHHKVLFDKRVQQLVLESIAQLSSPSASPKTLT